MNGHAAAGKDEANRRSHRSLLEQMGQLVDRERVLRCENDQLRAQLVDMKKQEKNKYDALMVEYCQLTNTKQVTVKSEWNDEDVKEEMCDGAELVHASNDIHIKRELVDEQSDNGQLQQMDKHDAHTNAHNVTVNIKTESLDCDFVVVKQEIKEEYEDDHDDDCDRCVVKREFVSDDEQVDNDGHEKRLRIDEVNIEGGMIGGGDNGEVDGRVDYATQTIEQIGDCVKQEIKQEIKEFEDGEMNFKEEEEEGETNEVDLDNANKGGEADDVNRMSMNNLNGHAATDIDNLFARSMRDEVELGEPTLCNLEPMSISNEAPSNLTNREDDNEDHVNHNTQQQFYETNNNGGIMQIEEEEEVGDGQTRVTDTEELAANEGGDEGSRSAEGTQIGTTPPHLIGQSQTNMSKSARRAIRKMKVPLAQVRNEVTNRDSQEDEEKGQVDEVPSRHVKRPRVDTTQANNGQAEVTRHFPRQTTDEAQSNEDRPHEEGERMESGQEPMEQETNYIDLQVETQFGQLRNRIVKMIEDGETVLGYVNALVLPQANTNQANSTDVEDNENVVNSESYSVEPRHAQVSAAAFVQPLPANCQNDLSIPSIAPSNMNNSNEHLSRDQIASPSTPLTHPIAICQLNQYNLVRKTDTQTAADNDAETGIDSEIGLNQNEIEGEPNDSVENDLMLMPGDVIEDSNQSPDKANNLSLINENEQQIGSVQKSTKNVTKPNSENGKSIQPVIELGHQSINTPSTSGLRSSNRKQIPTKLFAYSNGNVKSDKRKSKTESTSKVEIIKPRNEDENQQEEGDDEEVMNQSSGNVRDLSLITESDQKIRSVRKSTKQMTKQYHASTSGIRSSNRKRTQTKLFDQSTREWNKRESEIESSKAAKRIKSGNDDEKVKQQEGDEDDGNVVENGKRIVVTLEVNCAEPGCKTILKSCSMWKQHLSTFHGQMPYKHLEDNVRVNQHGQTEYPCTECEVVSISQKSLKGHWRYYHRAGKFECSFCAFVANFYGEVLNHHQKNHRSSKFQCTHQGCNQTFKYMKHLERHQLIHSGETPFKCTWDNCETSFNLFGTAIRHVRTQHFHLPRSIKEQKEQNIIDERDPKVYVQVIGD